jgi:hypothetical protein
MFYIYILFILYIQEAGSEERRSVSIRLQRVKSGDLIVFPETAEGYVDKVRIRHMGDSNPN